MPFPEAVVENIAFSISCLFYFYKTDIVIMCCQINSDLGQSFFRVFEVENSQEMVYQSFPLGLRCLPKATQAGYSPTRHIGESNSQPTSPAIYKAQCFLL